MLLILFRISLWAGDGDQQYLPGICMMPEPGDSRRKPRCGHPVTFTAFIMVKPRSIKTALPMKLLLTMMATPSTIRVIVLSNLNTRKLVHPILDLGILKMTV
jgi:hypothetical protein